MQVSSTRYQPSALVLSNIPEKKDVSAGQAEANPKGPTLAKLQTAKPQSLVNRLNILA